MIETARWEAPDRNGRNTKWLTVEAERFDAMESVLKRLLEWDQMNPPMSGDHAWWKLEIARSLGLTDSASVPPPIDR